MGKFGQYIGGLMTERSTYIAAATLTTLLTKGRFDVTPWMDVAMTLGAGAGNLLLLITRDTSKQRQ